MVANVDPTSTSAAAQADTRRAPPPDDAPSSRPTSVPDVELGAVAGHALAFDSRANIPLDLAVPRRVPGADTAAVDHPTGFLLVHVDGVSSIATIAAHAQVPVADALERFLRLLALGVIELTGRRSDSPPPTSGLYANR